MDSSTVNLPLSDPRCANDTCVAYYNAHQASQKQISWASQFLYGHYTTWYYIAVLGVAAAVHRLRLHNNRASDTKRPSFWQRGQAAWRAIGYTRLRGPVVNSLAIPTLGVLAFVALTSLYLLLLAFVQRPYYRLHRGFGSPPLAIRSGLMATALMPIIVALAGKVNFVTMLTGISHEKLNVYHRYASYMCLFLSIVHTVPFLVAPLKDGGYAALHEQYYQQGGYEFTGTPPFGMLVGLCALSAPFIRHRWYRLFYRLHIPLAIVFLGTMFWHAGQELDSWAYLWATLALWLASWLGRFFVKWQTFNVHRLWFSGYPSRLIPLPGDMIRVDVLVPLDFRWAPGQHCFLRFSDLSMLENHPFTIVSLPGGESAEQGDQELRFLVRSYSGLTRALKKTAESGSGQFSHTVHVDGPYGGLPRGHSLEGSNDALIFIAGGGGISACLPWMLHVAYSVKRSPSLPVKSIQLVWMVRHRSHLRWALHELRDVQEAAGKDIVKCEFHITEGDGGGAHSGSDLDIEKGRKADGAGVENDVKDASEVGEVRIGRPFLVEILPSMISSGKTAIFGCGPESLRVDLANAAAKAQMKVLRNKAQEVSLYSESFGW